MSECTSNLKGSNIGFFNRSLMRIEAARPNFILILPFRKCCENLTKRASLTRYRVWVILPFGVCINVTLQEIQIFYRNGQPATNPSTKQLTLYLRAINGI